jgi:DNA-binding MarR family transcriptional regulator
LIPNQLLSPRYTLAEQAINGEGPGTPDQDGYSQANRQQMVLPQSVTEIAHRIGLTAGSMSVALDRLERRGLIRRHAHPTDRRNRVIRLTGAGKKLIEKAFQEHASVMEDIGKSLSTEERGVLIELLKRLGKGAEELLRRTSGPGAAAAG